MAVSITRSGPVEGSPAEAVVFICALIHGPLPRVEIADRTGLSQAAVTRTTRRLLDSGYLQSAEVTPSQGPDQPPRLGRPTSPLRVNVLHTGAFGYKLTGDQIVGVVCDLGGTLKISRTVALSDTAVEPVLDALANLHNGLVAEAETTGFSSPPRHVGVSLSGDIDHRSGVVRYSPFLQWRDVPLAAKLTARLNTPVVIENDVKALTIAEQWFGHGRAVDDFAVLTIGAGIGCAMVIGGALLRGAHSVAGEIGHLPLGNPDTVCYCGGRGCVEAETSTTALLSACRTETGIDDLTEAEVVDLARAGDPRVTGVFARAGELLGLAVATLANLVGSRQVIVAGEAVSRYDLLEKSIRAAFARQAFGAASEMSIVVKDLPFDEWARGAAAVAIEDLAFPSSAERDARQVVQIGAKRA